MRSRPWCGDLARAQPPARRDVLYRAEHRRRCRTRAALRPAGHRRARIRPELHEFPDGQSALSGQPVEPAAPERRPGSGRCRARHRQRRALDPDGEPARTRAVIHHIDIDPLKQQMPLWYIGAKRILRADAATALRQLNERAASQEIDGATSGGAAAVLDASSTKSAPPSCASSKRTRRCSTGEILTAAVREHVDENTIVISEGITHYHTIVDHLGMTRPGSLFTSGGGSLGWHGGAAIGAKLAASGQDRHLPGRRRLLHVLRPLDRALDGAPVQNAVPAGRLQ